MRDLDMVTFVVLARNRHFGRTAEQLNTTQPAISSRLAALEAEFGCRLVHRGDREFQLTLEGERVLVVFKEILGLIDRLKDSVKSPDGHVPDVVRIGAIDSVASTWMPHLMESLQQIAPNLRVELIVEGTQRLVAEMVNGEFDLIFCLDPAIGDGFRSFNVCVWEMIWAGSPKLIDEARTYDVDELAQMPIITFPKNTPPYRQIAPYFQDESVLASKMTSSNSLFAIINLLIAGFGISAIPSITIQRELEMGLLRPIDVSKRFPPMPIIGTYQSSTHQDVIQVVVEQARRSARDFCDNAAGKTAWII
ncbi:LysR family transcriptional regulator [Polymorphum gilvum]|uniref:LysR family transcriptional regulator n=1 Tax=Polymorphum gilvum (strain LMG 25793 / CGMCC 1.9160 / SL003B-26A1) TaxID=991905 RepID=F2J403_POLGS|nr:LysR family transcriptional regulator [Polymorphum gilvum]ADZ68985.1 LysR family transcriptional regulator [Polymorphum gilvum SL003B-26A1]